jgi:hypothetical protein
MPPCRQKQGEFTMNDTNPCAVPQWLQLERNRLAARRAVLQSGLTDTVGGTGQPLVSVLAHNS